MTLGDLVKGLARYRPFVIAVAAVALVVTLVPGKPHHADTSKNTNVAAGPSAQSGPGEAAGPGATDNGGTSTAAGAGGTGATAGGAAGGTKVAAVGGKGTAGAAAANLPPGLKVTADPACDPATGRVKIPSLYAPPCVPPFNGNNGGATYQGVTATSIIVAAPYAQNSPAATAILEAAGDNDNQDQRNQTVKDYIDFFEHHVQTYGRKIDLRLFESNVNPNDNQNASAQASEAQQDAIHVAKELKAFASLGDAGDPPAFEDTLVDNGVPCYGCTTTLPASWYLQRAPFAWGNGLPDETQDYSMRAEMICDEINPFKPEFVGGPSNSEDDLKKLPNRVYGLLWP